MALIEHTCKIHCFFFQLFDLDNSNSVELEEFIAVASLNDKILGKKRTADEPLELDLAQLSQHLQQYKVCNTNTLYGMLLQLCVFI